MRWIVAITALLLGLGWIACQIELVGTPTGEPRADDGWRRTTGGWERLVSLRTATTPAYDVEIWRLHPHPLIVTLMFMMLSVTLLVASTGGEILDPDLSRRKTVTRGPIRT